MIPVRCTTNIDVCRNLRWPTELPVRPQVGDIIRSATTWTSHITHRQFIVELEVHGVKFVPNGRSYGGVDTWTIEVELHLPKNQVLTIANFQENFYQHTRGYYYRGM